VKTKAACRRYLESDEVLRNEISTKMASFVPPPQTEPIRELENDQENWFDDNSDIPLEAVIQHEVGIDVGSLQTVSSRFCLPMNQVDVVDGNFVTTSAAENVWAYNDNGSLWGSDLPTTAQ